MSENIFQVEESVKNYSLGRVIPQEIIRSSLRRLLNTVDRSRHDDEISIIDAGCGSGRFLLPLLEICKDLPQRFNIFGIDESGLMLEEIRNSISDLDESGNRRLCLKTADIQRPIEAIDDKSVDLVYTFAVFHILTSPFKALDNLATLIKDNGVFAFGREVNQFIFRVENYWEANDLPSVDEFHDEFWREYHNFRSSSGFEYVPEPILQGNFGRGVEHLRGIGFKRVVTFRTVTYEKRLMYGDILKAIQSGSITPLGADLDQGQKDRCYNRMRQFLVENSVDFRKEITFPSYLDWAMVYKSPDIH